MRVFNGITCGNVDHKEDLERIWAKLKDYCTPRSNVTFESYAQNQNESYDAYYTALCGFSQSYQFGDLADEMVHDRIVVGVKSKDLQMIVL